MAYFSNWHVLFLNVCTRVKVSLSCEIDVCTYNTLWLRKGITLNISEPQINVVLIRLAPLWCSNVPVHCSVFSQVREWPAATFGYIRTVSGIPGRDLRLMWLDVNYLTRLPVFDILLLFRWTLDYFILFLAGKWGLVGKYKWPVWKCEGKKTVKNVLYKKKC